MFQRIVCATDFSEGSKVATQFAASLARASGGHVDLVHCWQLPAELMSERLLLEADLIEGSRRAARASLESEAATLTDVRVNTLLIEGAPDTSIVAHAAAVKADVVVTGTHGRTGLSHVLLGSVAERIARLSTTPVLTIPAQAKAPSGGRFAPKTVLVPVDLTGGSVELLRRGVELAAHSFGRVIALHAWEMPFYFAATGEVAAEAERKVSALFAEVVAAGGAGAHHGVESILRQGPAVDIIGEVIAERTIDLVVLATRGRVGLERALLGSVAERVLRTARVPVLTVHRPS